MIDEAANSEFSGAQKLSWQRGICGALFLVQSICCLKLTENNRMWTQTTLAARDFTLEHPALPWKQRLIPFKGKGKGSPFLGY